MGKSLTGTSDADERLAEAGAADRRKTEVEKLMADPKLRDRVRAEAGLDVWYVSGPANQIHVMDREGEKVLRTVNQTVAQAEKLLRREFQQELEDEKRQAAREFVEVGDKRVPLIAPNSHAVCNGASVGTHVSAAGAYLIFGAESVPLQKALKKRWPRAEFPQACWGGRKWRPNVQHSCSPIPLADVEAKLTKEERAAVDALPESKRTRGILSIEVSKLLELAASVPRPEPKRHAPPPPEPPKPKEPPPELLSLQRRHERMIDRVQP